MEKTVSLDAEKKPMDGKDEALSKIVDLAGLHIDRRPMQNDIHASSERNSKSAVGSSRVGDDSRKDLEVFPSPESAKNPGVSSSLLTHPFRNSAVSIKPDSEILVKLPRDAYMPPGLVAYFDRLRNQDVEFTKDHASPKLVIPSIKRDLAFRYRKEVYARPFLNTFLTYILGPGEDPVVSEDQGRLSGVPVEYGNAAHAATDA